MTGAQTAQTEQIRKVGNEITVMYYKACKVGPDKRLRLGSQGVGERGTGVAQALRVPCSYTGEGPIAGFDLLGECGFFDQDGRQIARQARFRHFLCSKPGMCAGGSDYADAQAPKPATQASRMATRTDLNQSGRLSRSPLRWVCCLLNLNRKLDPGPLPELEMSCVVG
jgi:hypothetical protein